MSTSIPPEIVHAIISCLAHDHDDAGERALKACSLVGRAWLQPARAHFFHVVLTPVNVDEFVDLAASPSSFAAATLPDMALTRNWDAIHVAASFPVLKSVSGLVVHNMEYAPSPLLTILVALPSCTHLYLDQVSFGAFAELAGVVSLFPALQSLSLCDVSWPTSTSEPSSSPSARLPSSITHLSLTLCYQRDVFAWLLTHTPGPTPTPSPTPIIIPHLNLGPSVAPADAPLIGAYLAHVGPALRSLRLGFSSFDAGGDAEDFCAHVDLGLNTGVRELWFDAFVGGRERERTQVSTAGAWIVEIVGQVRDTNSVEVVCFGVDGDVGEADSDADAEVDWEVLDCHLVRLGVGRAQFVVLAEDDVTFDRQSRALRQRLPRAERAGVLAFVQRCLV